MRVTPPRAVSWAPPSVEATPGQKGGRTKSRGASTQRQAQVWDYFAALLQSPRWPRSGGVIDGIRRAAAELGTFLEIDAPGGHDPTVLDGEHMRRFVADQRRREGDGLASLAITQPGGKSSIVTTVTRSVAFNARHKMLRDALDTGTADRIGLARELIVAVPTAGATTGHYDKGADRRQLLALKYA
jgi:hypothetical protein